jgi:hypothetical protein
LSRDSSTAVLKRDGAQIGLTRKGDHQPREAGSLGFKVDDLDTLHRELSASGGNPGVFGIDEWGGEQYRTFFMREEENGYCFCFYCPVQNEKVRAAGTTTNEAPLPSSSSSGAPSTNQEQHEDRDHSRGDC